MKTSLPFLLLIFLASCSSSPKYVSWKRGTDSEIKSAANSKPVESQPATAPTSAANSSTNTGPGYLVPAVIPLGNAAEVPTPSATLTNTILASGVLTPTVPAAARTNAPVRPPLGTASQPGNAIVPRGAGDLSNAAPPTVMAATTGSTASGSAANEPMIPAGVIKFRGAPLEQVLEIYAKYRNRTLLFPANLNLQQQITLINQTDLTRSEVIEALNAVLALNGISMVDMDDKFVKVVAQGEVHTTGGPADVRDASQLQSMGQYLTRIVQLKYVLPSQMAQVLAPFAKIAGSIYPIDSSQILVLRDYTENIKRMLDMIERVDIAVPSEFIFEVIPIKYAKASEIAEAVSGLGGGGGGGGSTSPVGQRGATGAAPRGAGGGINRAGGQGYSPTGGTQFGGAGGINPGGAPGGAPGGGGSFNDRLNAIIKRAGATGGLQILGETKVINDDRSNSLLIFASRSDMETITNIIAKLDVVLAQVIIDSIIMDVQIGNAWAIGVSGLQKQNEFTKNLTGAGGYNNGQPLFDLVNFLAQKGSGTATNTFFPGSLGGGLTYWAQIGKSYDLVLQAAETDERINVIQKPRIMTTHATPGSIFVGSTVPYVTGTYYNGGYGGGPSSQYQQMQVGIGLQVTPFINSEGLVVMQIHEEISELSGSTEIQGVGAVPNTTTRQLDGEVAVRDGEAIMLGGFIRNSTDKKVSGIPLLKDIPLIGPLFGNNSKSKARAELMVLMRPTVLRTPDIAAAVAAEEKQKMPGILNAEFEAKEDQRKMLEKEKKDELNRKRLEKEKSSNGKSQSPTVDQPPEKSDY